METLLEYIQVYSPLNEQEVEAFQRVVKRKKYKKNDVFFKEGKVSNEIYFLTEGCVRLFYNVEGVDKTGFFYTEGKFICAGESFTYQVPAIENYQALEESVLYVLSRNSIEQLLQISPKFELMGRIAVENELITYQKMLASFVTKSAEQRYVELLAQQNELFQRVPQQYIASYLGVSPETLSRIKNRVFKKRLT